MSNDHKKFGARIRKLRRDRGLSQETLAEMVERSVEAISNVERGVSLPNFETLQRLADVFGTSIEDLKTDNNSVQNAISREELLQELSRAISPLDVRRLRLVVEHAKLVSQLLDKD